MGGVDVSIAVGLKKELVAGFLDGHAMFGVCFTVEVRRWCVSEPVGFIAAPAISEGREMAFGLQVDTEKRIAIGIKRRIADGATIGSCLAGKGCRCICGVSLHDGILGEFLCGWEPQLRRLHLSFVEQLRKICFCLSFIR